MGQFRRTVAVVGAGISGLCCARTLSAAGFTVRVFDKARRPSGRMSTRWTDNGLRFDHGAQYLTARGERFGNLVARWRRQGLVAPWRGPFVSLGFDTPEAESSVRYVGVPTMSAICGDLAKGLDIVCRTRIAELRAAPDKRWSLHDENGATHGPFDLVVIAVPAGQAGVLLTPSPTLAQQAAAVSMSPCWAVMAGFQAPLPVKFGGAFVHGASVRWAARQNSKPSRPPGEAWVIHADPTWTHAHWDDDAQTVVAALLSSFSEAAGFVCPAPSMATAHRWRYAKQIAAPSGMLLDDALGIGACGDWCAGPRIEDAANSGQALADAIVTAFASD